jgi:acetyl-CoA carboxylase carboxyltransferase component
LLGIASVDVRVPFDVREIIARVVDGSRFEEFKELLRPAARVRVGVDRRVPDRGGGQQRHPLLARGAEGGAVHCSCATAPTLPILFVQNITGFMVGTRYEQGGIIKDGAKLINAVSNSTVPHLTLMVGASYGAGNYAMAGRAYDPRFVFTWPNHRIAVMGPKQLAGVLSIVRRNAAAAAGRPFDEAADEELRQATESQIEEESTAQYATGRLWDDGIIDPRDTRTVLAIA